jgi:hypothetical protein
MFTIEISPPFGAAFGTTNHNQVHGYSTGGEPISKKYTTLHFNKLFNLDCLTNFSNEI